MGTITVKNLMKEFRSGIKAVDGISFDIKKGEIFGLLGPNGAGKTTTINILSTLMEMTEGEVTLCGYNVSSESKKVRECIGLVFQDTTLDNKLTARENLELHAELYGVSRSERNKRIDRVLNLVELKNRENDVVKTFSGGMQRRLEIARGLIHYPKVLFLDEPTLGLDPQTRKKIWEYIIDLRKKHNITILLTTHYMEEADQLCDRTAIIDNGKIIALDSPKKLKSNLGGDTVILTLSKDHIDKATSLFKNSKKFDGKLSISVKDADKKISKIVKKLEENNIEPLEINVRKPTLNDVFLKLTGREIRDEKAGFKDQLRRKLHGRGRR